MDINSVFIDDQAISDSEITMIKYTTCPNVQWMATDTTLSHRYGINITWTRTDLSLDATQRVYPVVDVSTLWSPYYKFEGENELIYNKPYHAGGVYKMILRVLLDSQVVCTESFRFMINQPPPVPTGLHII